MNRDFRRRMKRAANTPLPPLSPAFAYADDAARYAHELIGDQRDGEFGGAILRSQQGQFFATLPFKGLAESFNFDNVLPTDAEGNLVHPPGYRCFGLYHSHPNTFETLRAWLTSWPHEAINTVMSFFSAPDVIHSIRNKSFATVAYLSGLNGSLIKYVPSGTPEEHALALRWREELNYEFDHSRSIQGTIRQLAAVGDLSVIQSSEIWGGKVGKISPQFTLYSAVTLSAMPSKVVKQPAFSRVFANRNEALKFARSRMYQQPEQQYGFIFKYRDSERYLASEPVLGAEDVFTPDHVFAKNGRGAIVIPSDMDVVGLYYCDSLYRDPARLPAEHTQVFKHFIDPVAMAQGVRFSLALRFGRPVAPLPLWIAARDGALLEYVPSTSLAEEPYVRLVSVAEGNGLEIARDLLAGHVTPTQYIRGFAAMGELKVLYTSDVWRQAGRVTASWEAYHDLYRRALSPLFVTADDAARYAHEKILHANHDSDRIYGGLILQRADTRFVATEPLAGRNETFDPHVVLPRERPESMPPGCRVVAVYHSHHAAPSMHSTPIVERQLYRAMFEPHEVYAAINEREWAPARYLSVADGALLKYTPSGSALEQRFMQRIAPPLSDPQQARRNSLQSKLRSNTLKPSEFVAQIVRTGALHVISGSALWGNPGQVTTAWKPLPEPQVVYQVTQSPPYSPVFTQALDAIRDVRQRMGARKMRQFGVVLKSTGSEAFVATLPIEDGFFSLDRLFPARVPNQISLPAGFEFHGVFIGAPHTPATLATADIAHFRVYQAFASPVDIYDGLQLINLIGNYLPASFTGQIALYLSTIDGAVLRYAPTSISREIATGILRNGGESTRAKLYAGTLSGIQYVRDIAASGQLDVDVPSALWRAVGPVNTRWRPETPVPVPVDAAGTHRRFPLSPMFSHNDDAARHVHRQLERPHRFNRVMGILQSAAQDTFIAIEPSMDGEHANAPETYLFTHRHVEGQVHSIPDFPAGYSSASLHFCRDVRLHAADNQLETNLLRNMFWPVDICYATFSLQGINGDSSVTYLYLSTDDGALLRYWRGDQSARNRLCSYVSGATYTYQDYFAENNRAYRSRATPPLTPTPVEMLTYVLSSGGLRVLAASQTWRQKGVVGNTLTVSVDPVAAEAEWDASAQAPAPALAVPELPAIGWHDEL